MHAHAGIHNIQACTPYELCLGVNHLTQLSRNLNDQKRLVDRQTSPTPDCHAPCFIYTTDRKESVCVQSSIPCCPRHRGVSSRSGRAQSAALESLGRRTSGGSTCEISLLTSCQNWVTFLQKQHLDAYETPPVVEGIEEVAHSRIHSLAASLYRSPGSGR